MNQQEAYKTVFKEYPDILDVGQISELLSKSKKTAYKLLKSGAIASLKVCGNIKYLKSMLSAIYALLAILKNYFCI